MGDPHQVIVELVFGVLADFDGIGFGFGQIGDEAPDVVQSVVGEADDAAGEVGVAAAEVFGGFFDDQYGLGLLAGGDGGGEGGVAGAHHDDIVGIAGGRGVVAGSSRQGRHLTGQDDGRAPGRQRGIRAAAPAGGAEILPPMIP